VSGQSAGSTSLDAVPLSVIATGTANLASVLAAFSRLGVPPVVTADPAVVRAARAVVLPGVGSLGGAMPGVRSRGLDVAVAERVAAGRPTLGVCLGAQMFASASEESPGVPALGLLPVEVKRLPSSPTVRVPHMGWNAAVAEADFPFALGMMYFANSYAIAAAGNWPSSDGWTRATTTVGGHRFVSAFAKAEGRVLACQFHPELSGGAGERLLAAWLAKAGLGPGLRTRGGEAPVHNGLTARVVPCLDVRDGRVVKGVKFANLRDAGDPVERAVAYQRQGADELVLLDVSAGPEGRRAALHTVAAVRAAVGIPVCVGGGLRSAEDASAMLDAGADKVGVNSAAVARPALLGELAERFGRQCVVLSLDAARRADGEAWEVVTASGRNRTGLDAVAWAVEAVTRGAGEILLTSHDRDGTGEGYDLDLLRAIRQRVTVPIIASGGAASAADLAAALGAGADAALAATIFHDGHTTVGDVKAALVGAGLAIRCL